jgi:predicted regulator of Ras-like GTPase activity (Roadblock/LC7/MglB family)
MDAAQALADLTEISSQIDAAVLADADGAVLASTFPDEARARQLASAAQALLAAAEGVRAEGQPLAQLEASIAEGSVFVVRDAGRVIVATTTPQPTVGLVFYDLKSCLRAAAAEGDDDGKPRPQPRQEAELEDDDAA